MSVYKKYRSGVWNSLRPVVLGLLLAVAVTALLCGVFALVFVLLDQIVHSAVLPLALLSAGLGCFIGAYICARVNGQRGLIYGALVGLALFLIVWFIGLCTDNGAFGSYWLVKLLLLSLCGCIGGYIGSTGHRKRRRS